MAAFIEVAYDRQYTDADVQSVAARAGVTLSVLTQLGVAYQTLPGFAMAGYQTETTALTTDLMALQALVDQIRPLLISIDAKAKPIDEKNKGILRALQGLLQNDGDISLLYQITGPTAQSGGSTPPTPPPAPPTP